MSHESTRCISSLFYTNKHDKMENNCVTAENTSLFNRIMLFNGDGFRSTCSVLFQRQTCIYFIYYS